MVSSGIIGNKRSTFSAELPPVFRIEIDADNLSSAAKKLPSGRLKLITKAGGLSCLIFFAMAACVLFK
jgi:hypothetical protein